MRREPATNLRLLSAFLRKTGKRKHALSIRNQGESCVFLEVLVKSYFLTVELFAGKM